MALAVDFPPADRWLPERPAARPRDLPETSVTPARRLECAEPDDDEEDLGDEESNFDDFDDEFDDDFEEEENDPDWDHPDDGEADEPPAGKGPTRRK